MVDKHSVADYLEYKGAKIPQRAGGWRKMRCPFHDDGHADRKSTRLNSSHT